MGPTLVPWARSLGYLSAVQMSRSLEGRVMNGKLCRAVDVMQLSLESFEPKKTESSRTQESRPSPGGGGSRRIVRIRGPRHSSNLGFFYLRHRDNLWAVDSELWCDSVQAVGKPRKSQ